MRSVVVRRRATMREILQWLGNGMDILLPLTRKGVYRMKYAQLPDLEDYLPASVYLTANSLERKGWVEKTATPQGIRVRITSEGRKRVLQYSLADLKPPEQKWDGQWRLVFFDIAEVNKGKRDSLRKFLGQLGMEQMQESVFVSPHDVFEQVEYLREVLDVPNGVKLAKLAWIENGEDLKKIFDLE